MKSRGSGRWRACRGDGDQAVCGGHAAGRELEIFRRARRGWGQGAWAQGRGGESSRSEARVPAELPSLGARQLVTLAPDATEQGGLCLLLGLAAGPGSPWSGGALPLMGTVLADGPLTLSPPGDSLGTSEWQVSSLGLFESYSDDLPQVWLPESQSRTPSGSATRTLGLLRTSLVRLSVDPWQPEGLGNPSLQPSTRDLQPPGKDTLGGCEGVAPHRSKGCLWRARHDNSATVCQVIEIN